MKVKLEQLQIKGYIAGFLTCALLLSSITAFANTGGVMREIFYGVRVVHNGQPIAFDADMMPFIMDGRTFLPVRGISDLLGVPVAWDGPTQTVYLGTSPIGQPFWQTVPPFQQSRVNGQLGTATVNMLGQPHANAIRNSAAFGVSNWSDHNLNAQYSTFTGIIGRIDGIGSTTSTVSFIGDGRELASFTVDGNTLPHEISVDVTGVLILRIQIEGTPRRNNNVSPAIANAMIQ